MTRLASPDSPVADRDLRLLVVGAGQRTVDVLLPALRRAMPTAQVAAICDPDPTVAARIAGLTEAGRQPDDIPVFAELDRALAAGPYQVAILACPHDQHQEATLRLTDAHIAVWKEKPYALTLQQAVHLATRDVRVLAHRPHGQLLQIATDRMAAWGRLLSYRIRITRPTGDYTGTWRASAERAGGGAICDLGYHAFDLISRLTGRPSARPATVYAVTTSSPAHRPAVEVEESAHLTITHVGGCAGTVHLSRCEERADEIDMVAEHGRITISGDRSVLQVTTPAGRTHRAEVTAADDDPWAAMLRYHAQTLGDTAVTAAEARTGITATALMEAAYTSVRLGRSAPVASCADFGPMTVPVPVQEGRAS
ncbi:Gfo/Idh/MocA family oxidoreductase [Actinomadura darangshiensis]|uniref:Gfo/Idh/MocA family oxidoreductase n=1 Tax=Actinomadura darangshiensis TaxID=705336 RepID=A0A4V6PF25_9ACTN|nr:Gfo/Idh/MocA family oxidoreductase [Actinomadura darangshiensis]TDD89507.1 Gfo/Idh/MocA family oxidoreductase [Actinomadura darangshiensis]